MIISIISVYTSLGLLFPSAEKMVHKCIITLFLLVASYNDVKDREFPVLICIVILIVNIIHTLFVPEVFKGWIAGMTGILFLLLVHFVNQKTIGIGDIILLGLCMSTLLIKDILNFLFLSFFFSSVYGVVLGIFKKKVKDLAVPLVPSISLAFMLTALLSAN
jgi:Flp pilus assembly protein protease CpaA